MTDDQNRGDVPDDPSADAAGAGSAATPEPPRGGRRKATKEKGFFRRHKILVSVGVVLLVIAGTIGVYLYQLNHQLSNIQRVDSGIKADPEKDHNAGGKPLNILLLGADHGGGDVVSVADDLKDGEWTPWTHLSDTIMIVHIPADRDSLQVVSIPRDTWVKIDGYPYGGGHGKINAAFSYGGPELATTTVQELTGITIDHLAIIDWAGFRDLTSALGGVKVYIPKTFYDPYQKVTWEKGWQELEDTTALKYVRTRHGLENGDFGRIQRQQNFIRATMGELLSKGTTRNPIKLLNVVSVITDYLTVDDSWDNDEIRSLALGLRNLKTEDVNFLTAPLGGYGTSPDGQSIVRLDKKQSRALFRGLRDDDIDRYLKRYPDQQLPDDQSIN